METSAIPLRFILTGRRILYYWTILNKPGSELVKQVFEAQKEFETNDSWVKQVENDLRTCEIDLKEEDIKKLSQYKIKKLVANNQGFTLFKKVSVG